MNTAELALIGAITSDEKCKARIDKLVEEQGKVELQIERMAAMQGAADATLAEADRKTRAAINIREDAEQRSASLVEFEATLLAMQQALAAEKEKFEEVRAQVDKQQCEASEALNVCHNPIAAFNAACFAIAWFPSARKRLLLERQKLPRNTPI